MKNANKQYEVAKKPGTKMWFVIGYCGRSNAGRKQYIPVSDGYATKSQALTRIPELVKADIAMKQELAAI